MAFVMEIVVLLRRVGLEKYEAAFRENEIDETVLPSLTNEHLKEPGVTARAPPPDPKFRLPPCYPRHPRFPNR